MATSGFKNIVTSGLVLSLDAGNTKSYSGSGTSWLDLTSNSLNGTLTNCTFTALNAGSIAFNGSTSYASSTGVNLSGYNQITVEVWFKLNTTSNSIVFEHSSNWNTNTGGFGLAANNDGLNINPDLCHSAFYQGGSITARNYAFTCGTQSYSCHVNIYSNIVDATGRLTYVNGQLLTYSSINGYPTTTATTTGSSFRNDTMFFASRAGSVGLMNGNISLFRIYNRKLSEAEVLQNYNATKTRFI